MRGQCLVLLGVLDVGAANRLRLGLLVVDVLRPLLTLLLVTFLARLFPQKLLAPKSITLYKHDLLLLTLNGWRNYLTSLAFQVVREGVLLQSLVVVVA